MTVAEIIERASKAGLKPTELITVSQWADKYRIIPRDGGAKEPGPWRTSRFPFLREPMDNLSLSSSVQFTIIMAGTQVGKTECGHNFMGYTIHIAPAPFLLLLPSLDVAKRRSRTKIKHTIEQTPVLKERVADPRERDSDNMTLFKAFRGGALIISGANSAASLRDISCKNLHLDEVDAYELDLEEEGDTIDIALKRADSFGTDKRVLITSTPTTKGFSKIEREFENSDQRHYYVPCPQCGHMQYLRWKDGAWNGNGEYRLVFEHDEQYQLTSPVRYRCEACGHLIDEYHKTWMLEHGEWRAHNPGHRRRGYKLPALYSPLGFLSWQDIAQEFLDAKRAKDMEKMKTWKNTRLAETWDDEEDPIIEDEQNILLARRENYGLVVPMAGLVLVAGVDVQRDRVEINVAAFGIGEEWWNMEYKIISGSIEEQSVQQDLDDYLFAPWLHASGAIMHIKRILIDSGDGVNSQAIYDYVKSRQKRGLFAAKGSQFSKRPIFERARKANQGGIRHYNIGTDTAKDSIFNRLAITKAKQLDSVSFVHLTAEPVEISPMYVHWNMEGYDEEYFLQLTAEVPVKEKKGRRYARYYKQVRARNEALDTAVLCLAAIRIMKPNWATIIERLAKKAKEAHAKMQQIETEEAKAETVKPKSETIEQVAEKPQMVKTRKPTRRVGGWVNGWR